VVDAEQFHGMIPLALDYHLWRGDERAKARNPDKDYHDPAYLMFPVPVLAMLKLRQQFRPGEFVEADHPLLELPNCKPQPKSAPPTDETTDLLERIVTGLEAERTRQFPQSAR
jgi:hypothetical protein